MSRLGGTQGCDPYELEELSDEERAASSSEDELDVLLNGTPDQRKKLIREYLTGESESSSEDEFEKEMATELSSTIRTMEGAWCPGSGADGGGGGGGVDGSSALPTPQMYDEVYFDSDSESEDTPSAGSSTGRRQRRRQSQRVVLTNDELFYDPDKDSRDQAWVDARRRMGKQRPAAGLHSQPFEPQTLRNSDAILNCPACMTTLCLDCQRHEKYRTQYRAMFVMNCTVKKDEVLRYKNQPDGKRRKRRRGRRTEAEEDEASRRLPAGVDADEVYHPVQCSECCTEVAVFDRDEVYHFFNILSSHC
ncbi:E2F-associated phosphoprotein [Cololabis saira]|uniref:E2F-associated phosphoprotein n=1 Tax=Cololabis saira TaxID=129043 RepID=UPI002AD356DA|nr:E2F-associated phosphoprotein [Cololabis saira]